MYKHFDNDGEIMLVWFQWPFGHSKVLVSYEITRGIILVVGRVTEEVKGGLGDF